MVTQLSDDDIQRLLLQAEARIITTKKSSIVEGTTQPRYHRSDLKTTTPYISLRGDIVRINSHSLIDEDTKKLSTGVRQVEDSTCLWKKKEESKKIAAGPKWFDLPKTTLDPELRRDFQVLRMRKVLEPDRHYKREGGKLKIPEFSQVGSVIQGPTEFYSARLSNRERHRSIAAGVLVQEMSTNRFKNKYRHLQLSKTSGKKAHYKILKTRRSRINKQ